MCIKMISWFLQMYFTAEKVQKRIRSRINLSGRQVQKDPLRLQRITSIEMHNATGTKYVVIVNIQNAKVVVRSESWYGYKIRRHLKLNRCARHVKKKSHNESEVVYLCRSRMHNSFYHKGRKMWLHFTDKDSRVVGWWMRICRKKKWRVMGKESIHIENNCNAREGVTRKANQRTEENS